MFRNTKFKIGSFPLKTSLYTVNTKTNIRPNMMYDKVVTTTLYPALFSIHWLDSLQ